MKPSKKLSLVLLIAAAAFGCSSQTTNTPQTSETSVLRQEQSIQLPNVEGRIDHMAIDSQSGRLFIAALGNNTLEVIDLKASKVADEIKDLKEPQGVAYVPEGNKLLITNGEGDSLDIYDARSLTLLSQVVLGDETSPLLALPMGGVRLAENSAPNVARRPLCWRRASAGGLAALGVCGVRIPPA